MKRVITYGTFDLLHYGHINILRRAKELGDYLIVVLSSDEFNWNEKHKKCYFSYEQRKQLLEAIRYVDLVIPENSWEQKVSDMHEYHIDTFVMGDDWKGKFDFLKDEGVATGIELVRLVVRTRACDVIVGYAERHVSRCDRPGYFLFKDYPHIGRAPAAFTGSKGEDD